MRLEITNISYSTALTYELVSQYGFQTLGAPTFPTLRKEAIYKTDSAGPTALLFLQYKLGTYVSGSNSALKDYWGIPYHRFSIHPRREIKRHELLLNLEGMSHQVYYTAPEFHTTGELYDSVMKRAVLARSTFWSPQEIGAFAQPEKYTVSYKRGNDFGVLHPGDRRIDGLLKGEMLLTETRKRLESVQAGKYDDARLLQLGDQMLENYLSVSRTAKERRLIGDIRKGRERIDARDYLSLISILLYDCFVYLIARP